MRPPELADTLDGSVPSAMLYLYACGSPRSRSAIWEASFLFWSGSRVLPLGAMLRFLRRVLGAMLRFLRRVLGAMLLFLRRLLFAMLRFLRRHLCAPEFRLDP